MVKVRIIVKKTGRQIKSVIIDDRHLTSKDDTLWKVCDNYNDGIYLFNGIPYMSSELAYTYAPIDTPITLTTYEKITLLMQNGIYRSAAERVVKEDMVIFYPDNSDGMKDYFATLYNESNVKVKKHAWNRLDKVDYFDEFGNFLGAYRYDYFV